MRLPPRGRKVPRVLPKAPVEGPLPPTPPSPAKHAPCPRHHTGTALSYPRAPTPPKAQCR